MKKIASFLVLTSLYSFADVLPGLHQIKTITLPSPYSCGGSYEKSAIFLSDFSRDKNAPDLLYNGACGSENNLEASTAGDDFSLIADLGEVNLEAVTAAKAFNLKNMVGSDNTFKENAKIKLKHVYAVLTSKAEIRSLIIYKVISHNKDGRLTLQYAVKSYSLQETIKESSGFDWEKKNK